MWFKLIITADEAGLELHIPVYFNRKGRLNVGLRPPFIPL